MKNSDLFSQIKILKKNSHYRLGDLFFQAGPRWKYDRGIILNSDEYAGTILREYLEKKKKEQDYESLAGIIKEHSENYDKPTGELVIHLRLGDCFSFDDSWSHEVKRDYVSTKIKYQNLLNRIEIPPYLNEVKIVSALHYGNDTKVENKFFYTDESYLLSKDVFNFVCKILEKKVKRISVKSSDGFDEDLCYMCNAKHFVRSLSPLSKIIVEVGKRIEMEKAY